MIKKVISIVILSVLTIACKNEGNKGVLKTDAKADTIVLTDKGEIDSTVSYNTDINGKKFVKTDFVYKATDGSLVKVIFNYDSKARSLKITNNNKTFVLDKTSSEVHQTIYEKDDMKATVKGDSLIIDQGNNIIELKRTKI